MKVLSRVEDRAPEREFRITNSEAREKPEFRIPKANITNQLEFSAFGLRISFGFRASDFEFAVQLSSARIPSFCRDSRHSTLGSMRGVALVDCLAYMALLAMILTMAFACFYRVMEHSHDLTRNAADIARALNAGERWRVDVRASTRPPRLETVGDETLFRLAGGAGDVSYAFRAGAVLRQALPNTNWVELLPRATGSRMFEERRQHVGVWRWEVELKGGERRVRTRPLFSFQAVPSGA